MNIAIKGILAGYFFGLLFIYWSVKYFLFDKQSNMNLPLQEEEDTDKNYYQTLFFSGILSVIISTYFLIEKYFR